MKSSVYNIFDDVSEKEFPGFKEVTCQTRSSSSFLSSFQTSVCAHVLCVHGVGYLVGVHSRTE
jgi:hypothetical protein